MPSVDIPPPPEKIEANNESTAPATLPVIGIIYPPPEVRNIVDKTASFVARNGPEFESRIRQNELGNPKFNFLNSGDPYNAYYNHKVKEFKEGRGQEVSLAGTQIQKSVPTTTQLKQQELLKQAQTQEQPFIPKDPPPEYEFIADPPSISALDLDVVKLTAQFVARNGRQFLTSLMNKEQRNYQFDFLRPQHSLFQYFTKLLEQYTKILIPPKDLMTRLKEEALNQQVILDQVKYRADWQRHQEAQRRKEEMIIERERIAYAQIDWHDFVVVETVDYQPGEIGNFPPPTTPEEVGARVLMQDRQASKKNKGDDQNDDEDDENEMQIGSDDEMMDRTDQRNDSIVPGTEEDEIDIIRKIEETKSREGKDNTQVEDMEEESSSESEDESRDEIIPLAIDRKQFGSTAPPLPPLPPAPDRVIVKKGYDPKLARQHTKSTTAAEFISPLTNTKIPAHKVDEHVRINLLDSKWLEQRDKHIQDRMNQESVYAPGAAIEASLKQLAERRTDIFGVGDEETAIGKKIGEEDVRKDDKITWDGHTSSVEAATRAARANITIEDQIHQIHKVKGLLPDEEKEKIGPKPVTNEPNAPSAKSTASTSITQISKPTTVISKSPLIATLPSSVSISQPPMPKQPPLPTTQATTSAPPVPAPRQPLPPAPPGILPTPNPPVMLIPGSAVPQMNTRTPMMVPQRTFTMMPPGTAPMPQTYMPHPQAGVPPMPVIGMKHGMMDKMDEEPIMKRARTEDTLEPEEQFLAKHQGPVTFRVIVPNMPEKAEWKLGGQTLEMTLPLEDPVSVIKAKIHEVTNMPPGKQKLNWEGLFLKDSNSLAYYNVTPATFLQLQLKERGGRKK